MSQVSLNHIAVHLHIPVIIKHVLQYLLRGIPTCYFYGVSLPAGTQDTRGIRKSRLFISGGEYILKTTK